MKFGYTIIYIPNVDASLTFFETTFGFARRFLHESGTYGELDTGETTLAFAAHALGAMNFPAGHIAAHESAKALGIEIAFVTDDVPGAHASAVRAGALELSALKRSHGGKSCRMYAAHMERWSSFVRLSGR